MDKINLITKNKEQIYINAEESSEDIYERQRMVRDLILAAIALYLIDGDRKKLLDTIKSNITELMEFEQEKILKIVENSINSNRLNNLYTFGFLYGTVSVLDIVNGGYGGKNIQQRIVNHVSQLLEKIVNGIEKYDKEKVTFEELKGIIDNQFNINAGQTYKLINTEVSRVVNESDIEVYRKNEIEEVRLITTLDNKVCNDCSSQHGKIYNIKDVDGLLPKHPNCRCFFEPVINTNY